MRYVEGLVTAVNGDMATVEVGVAENGCGRCHEVGGCGGQNLSRAFCHKRRNIVVANTLGAAVGNHVEIGMDDAAIAAFATRVYVVPLLGILGGAMLGQALAEDGSLGGVAGALAGFVAAMVYSATRPSVRLAGPKMVRHGESAAAKRM